VNSKSIAACVSWESGFTPLIRLPAIRMSHALDIWCYTRADFAGSLDGVEFRKKAKMSVKEQAQVEAQVLHLFERYLAVEELLGLTIEWDKPREAPYPVLNVNEADRAARSLRQDWGLGLDPLPNLVG